LQSRHPIGSEAKRKLLHAGIGVGALGLPFMLTEAFMVAAGLALVLGWMLAVRRLPFLKRRFGAVLDDCKRRSWGEVYFALSLAALLCITPGFSVLYALPVLILAFADAAAAIAGRLIPSRALTGLAAGKTVAGSGAFFLVAAGLCLAVLFAATDVPAWQVVIAAAIVAIATCMAEAVCRHGQDNLAVPLVAWGVLWTLQQAAEPAAGMAQDAGRYVQLLLTGGG